MSSGLGAAVVLCALFASPATAAGGHKPDGWVRYEGYHSHYSGNIPDPGPWKGQNVYNTTALNQTVTKTAVGTYDNGSYFYYTITINNDGSSAERFKVKGTGTYAKYFHGSTNITAAVKNGTYKTSSVAAGGTTTITVRLTPYGDTALVTITSTADSSAKDAVKAKSKYNGCGC